MKKNLAPIFGIAIVFALLLCACGGMAVGKSAAEKSSDSNIAEPAEVVAEPVTITFWHTYNEISPENEMLVNTLVPLFEAEHPNIKVESLPVAYEDFRTKLFTSISGGVAPDLARIDIIWTPELADMGALASIDEEMSDFADYKDLLFAGPLATNFWNGHYYGLPLDTNTKLWFYNKALYDSAGITAPASVDEMLDQCQMLKAANPNVYYFATDGTWAWVVLPWIWSFGGDITDVEVTTATGYLNGAQTVAAFEFLKELYDQGCIAPVIMGSGIDTFAGYGQDVYASLDNGPWTFPIVESQFPDKEISISPFPAGVGGSINVVGGENIVLFQQSENKEAAMEFLRFVLSKKYQEKMAEVGQLPVRVDLIESDFIKNHEYYGMFLEQLKTSKSRTAHPKWSQMDEIITNAGQLILRNEKSAQEALDEAAAQIDELLK